MVRTVITCDICDMDITDCPEKVSAHAHTTRFFLDGKRVNSVDLCSEHAHLSRGRMTRSGAIHFLSDSFRLELVAEAREKRVCRICHRGIGNTSAAPKDDAMRFGELLYPARITYNFGREHAHTECIEKEAKGEIDPEVVECAQKE